MTQCLCISQTQTVKYEVRIHLLSHHTMASLNGLAIWAAKTNSRIRVDTHIVKQHDLHITQ